jgi:hypothetical protein
VFCLIIKSGPLSADESAAPSSASPSPNTPDLSRGRHYLRFIVALARRKFVCTPATVAERRFHPPELHEGDVF